MLYSPKSSHRPTATTRVVVTSHRYQRTPFLCQYCSESPSPNSAVPLPVAIKQDIHIYGKALPGSGVEPSEMTKPSPIPYRHLARARLAERAGSGAEPGDDGFR